MRRPIVSSQPPQDRHARSSPSLPAMKQGRARHLSPPPLTGRASPTSAARRLLCWEGHELGIQGGGASRITTWNYWIVDSLPGMRILEAPCVGRKFLEARWWIRSFWGACYGSSWFRPANNTNYSLRLKISIKIFNTKSSTFISDSRKHLDQHDVGSAGPDHATRMLSIRRPSTNRMASIYASDS
jgi:hypothetical protein